MLQFEDLSWYGEPTEVSKTDLDVASLAMNQSSE